MKLVTILRALDLTEAIVVKSRLEAYGLTAFLADNHHAAINWMVVPALGGVRVMVLEIDFERARDILQQTAPRDVQDDPPLAAQISAGAITLVLPNLVSMFLPVLRRWPRLFR